MRRAALVYSDVLSQHRFRENHPMVPARLRFTYELIEAYGAFLLPNALLVEPRRASDEELHWFHTPAYVDAVRAFGSGERLEEASRFNLSAEGDTPAFPGMYEAAAWSTGASLKAVELLMEGTADVACNFSGGLHHAMPGYASGFCVFNDPVVAIKSMTRRGLKVAYVDIDCHHGDGVQYAFYDTNQVLTVSIHESGRHLFPGTGFTEELGAGRGRGYSVNVPLLPHTGDDVYLWALREVVPPLVRAFKPNVLVTQLGIDSHFKDPITHLQLTVQGFGQAVKELGELSPGRWLALGGGGYDISAVARGWTIAYGRMLETNWPNEVPASFQEQYGLKSLYDTPPVDTNLTRRSEVRRYAEESVEAVRRLVFPFHGLAGTV